MTSNGSQRFNTDTNTPDTTVYTYSHIPSVVTVVYHPKGDLANTVEKRCRLSPGDKISVSALERVFQLRVVKECGIDGSNEIVIPYDASTGDSLNPIQLGSDGEFHVTGDPSGPMKLSLMQYLSIVPPASSYGNTPSRSSTIVNYQRRPSLLPWDNFMEQVRNWASTFASQNDYLYDPPVWVLFNRICDEVSQLQPFISKNILEPVVKPFDGWQFIHFRECGTPLRGEPDFVFVKDGSVHSVVEVQGNWNVPAERNIRSQYHSDHHVAGAVDQLYTYLVLNHRKAGVLTTYDMTWFFDRREENGEELVYVSDGIAFNSEHPTLFQCLSYFMHNVASDTEFKSPPSSRASSARSLRESSSQEMTRSPLSQSFSADDINTGEKIGEERTGAVFLADSNLTALKTLDIVKKPKLLPEIMNEISMYSKLESLQGRVVPRLRYCGLVEGILFVVGFDYVGNVPETLDENQKRKLSKGLAEIHSMGILHGDIRLGNIVVDSMGNPFIIDFTFSKIESDPELFEEEFSRMQNLLSAL